jgi:hypothetical protein
MSCAAWINRLNSSDSRLHKEEVLREALGLATIGERNAEIFLGFANATYNPMVTWGVKQVSDTVGITDGENPWSDFNDLLNKLHRRELTGGAAKDAIHAISQRFDSEEWNLFCAAVLRKDLRAGISDKTINKVLKNTQYQVPVFSCQLATSCEDRPEMVGRKRLEPKLDGCLSADWVIEFDDGTKVSIKEAVEKQIKGKVKSFNTITGKVEFNNVIGWAKDGHDDVVDSYEWFELELDSGKILPPLTGNHLVYLPLLKCYRRVDQLCEGDIILEDV